MCLICKELSKPDFNLTAQEFLNNCREVFKEDNEPEEHINQFYSLLEKQSDEFIDSVAKELFENKESYLC